jgi:repressor LexA
MLKFRLKQLRKERGVTQASLAGQLHISQQAVAKWEAGLSFPEPGMLVRLSGIFGVSTDYLLGRKNGSMEQAIPCGVFTLVPVVGTVRAGFGLQAFEDDLGTDPADVADPENYFYLVVRGDSMEPYIREGDLALVRRQNILRNGDLGVMVYRDGEGTLKRFFQEDGRVLLKSFNPAYEDLALSGEELSSLYIMGKVVETKTRW